MLRRLGELEAVASVVRLDDLDVASWLAAERALAAGKAVPKRVAASARRVHDALLAIARLDRPLKLGERAVVDACLRVVGSVPTDELRRLAGLPVREPVGADEDDVY
jgi:hypothetical protein